MTNHEVSRSYRRRVARCESVKSAEHVLLAEPTEHSQKRFFDARHVNMAVITLAHAQRDIPIITFTKRPADGRRAQFAICSKVFSIDTNKTLRS
jgi:hypothetical protein